MKGELKRYLSADGSVVCAVLDGSQSRAVCHVTVE